MKVRTNISRRDLIKINLFLWPKVRWNWVFLIIVFAICLVVAFTTLGTENINTTGSVILLFFVAGVVTIATQAVGFALCIAINISMASQRTGLGEHNYEITPEGLHETTSINSEFSKWASFDDLFRSRNYILLKKHWAALHIFPRRDFDSQQQFMDFFKTLSEKLDQN